MFAKIIVEETQLTLGISLLDGQEIYLSPPVLTNIPGVTVIGLKIANLPITLKPVRQYYQETPFIVMLGDYSYPKNFPSEEVGKGAIWPKGFNDHWFYVGDSDSLFRLMESLGISKYNQVFRAFYSSWEIIHTSDDLKHLADRVINVEWINNAPETYRVHPSKQGQNG